MYRSFTIAVAFAGSTVHAAPVFTARSADLEAYLSLVSATEADLTKACQSAAKKAPARSAAWLRMGQRGLEIAPDEARDAEAAAFWAEVALGARAAARRLYGAAAAETFAAGPVLIELDQGGASVFAGGARTTGDICDAMTRVVGAMGAASAINPFAAAREVTTAPAAPIAIGGETEISLQASLAPGSTLRGPDGITAELTDNGGAIRLTANAEASVGAATLRIYADGDTFRPAEEIPLKILPGADSPLPAKQIGALRLGGDFVGDLPLGGAVELDLTLTEARSLTLAAVSNADLTVELLTKAGQPVARDDDSGSGYGFSLNAALPPGGYVVKITHCCGGGGAFSVSATSE